MTEQELVFLAYPVQATLTSGQVMVGPCVLDGVFEMANPLNGTYVLYDGRNNQGRIVMRMDGLGLTEPMRFPDLRVRLESGLFIEQLFQPTRWTFILAKAP